MQKYAKLVVSVIVTVLTALLAVLTDGVTASEWVTVAVAGVTAAGVFAAPNVPGSRYTKVILAVLGTVLAALVQMILGGIDTAEVIQLLVLAAGAVGVYAVPNKSGDVNLSDTGSAGV